MHSQWYEYSYSSSPDPLPPRKGLAPRRQGFTARGDSILLGAFYRNLSATASFPSLLVSSHAVGYLASPIFCTPAQNILEYLAPTVQNILKIFGTPSRKNVPLIELYLALIMARFFNCTKKKMACAVRLFDTLNQNLFYPFRAQNLSLFTSPTDMVQGWGRRLIAKQRHIARHAHIHYLPAQMPPERLTETVQLAQPTPSAVYTTFVKKNK